MLGIRVRRQSSSLRCIGLLLVRALPARHHSSLCFETQEAIAALSHPAERRRSGTRLRHFRQNADPLAEATRIRNCLPGSSTSSFRAGDGATATSIGGCRLHAAEGHDRSGFVGLDASAGTDCILDHAKAAIELDDIEARVSELEAAASTRDRR